MLDISRLDQCCTSEIIDLIEVKEPYFALDELCWDSEGWLVAKAPVQCQSQYENTLMDASEVGRHLAILGSCVGALTNPEKTKHYYLACEAKLETYKSYMSDSRPEYLFARAKAEFINKRELQANAEILDVNGGTVARLEVKYHVLKEKSFNRIYGDNVAENIFDVGITNPYENTVKLEIMDFSGNALTTSVGEVKPEMCLGHFDQVKALPVAILSQCFLNSSYLLLRKRLNEADAKFVLKSCDLKAAKLATAGQRVEIQVTHVGSRDRSFTTRCVAKNHLDEVVGEMLCQIDKAL